MPVIDVAKGLVGSFTCTLIWLLAVSKLAMKLLANVAFLFKPDTKSEAEVATTFTGEALVPKVAV